MQGACFTGLAALYRAQAVSVIVNRPGYRGGSTF